MNTVTFALTLIEDAQLCLGPLILIGLLALTRTRPQLAILLTAIVALALLLLGVVIYDSSTQLVGYHTSHAEAVAISLAFLGIGGALSFAATVLALSRSAQTRRSGWFAGLAIFLVIGAVATVAAYDRYSLVIWELRIAGQPFFVDPAGLSPFYFSPLSRSPFYFSPLSRSPFYFIIWSVVVVIAALMALLYGALVRDESATRTATSQPPGAYIAPATPGHPASIYPPAGSPPAPRIHEAPGQSSIPPGTDPQPR
jgi:uncharacterized membrane protein YuzA (DUF378 family)